MPQTVFENHEEKPARFVDICFLDEPYFWATRREGELGTWGDWEMLEGESLDDVMPWEMDDRWDEVVQAVKDDLGTGWKIAAQRDVPTFAPSSEILAERYGVELPERLAKFFDDREWVEYQDMDAHNLPMWAPSFQVVFNEPGVHMNWEMVEMADESDRERFVALSPLLGQETHDFLALRIDDPNLPVAMWHDSSGTFHAYRESFDAFLEALT